MKINGIHYRTIWPDETNKRIIHLIDQTMLPFIFEIKDMKTSDQSVQYIKKMVVRGAPLIGITAIFGMYLAVCEAVDRKNAIKYINHQAEKLIHARPTAVDLEKSVKMFLNELLQQNRISEIHESAFEIAVKFWNTSANVCKKIGEHGLPLIESVYNRKKSAVNILTHCNAGWLATVDYGTALAPIYMAHQAGIPLHIWIDETRPRNQGSLLTAFELLHEHIHHTIIVDNAGGYLMQKGMVDMVIVGTDRTTLNGDVTNKTGTYLKALAAYDNQIPFYVAAPSSSIDFEGNAFIIEERSGDEVRKIRGKLGSKIVNILITNEKSPVSNYAFDITPARLVTRLITERGICKPDRNSILSLFPEKIKVS